MAAGNGDASEQERRERLLGEYAKTGSDEARDALLESFLPLADYFARKYALRSAELDDLHQVARIGLLKSIIRFDPSHGVKFATYAGRTMDGEIKRFFRDKTWPLRVPRSIKDNVQVVNNARKRLEQVIGSVPTTAEIADDTGLDVHLVIEALEASSNYHPARLDKPVGPSTSETLGDALHGSDSGIDVLDLRMTVAAVLGTIPERDREILDLRYIEDLSQQEIADRIELSQMQVSRILRRTLDRLQAQLHEF